MEVVPKKGFKGLIENWQSDLLAAISVSLVAMPLALGIAYASGVPPMSGIISAIIGGIVTTFFRGSYVGINGPTAGLIAVILVSISVLNDGSGNSLNYVFAAFVVSGVIQVILGLLKLGSFANIFPSSVIHGILAAIGIIIFADQIHVALGTIPSSSNSIDKLIDIFYQASNINPFIACISVIGIIILIFNSKLSYKFFHFLPAPIWVLALSLPLVYAFNFFEPHQLSLFGKIYHLGPEYLINLPDNFIDCIIYPNFSKIGTSSFWLCVISINLISSIETLASSKAVDKLDPYKRKTDLNKDLSAVGLSTIVSGAIGGLPVINVIIRSTVNVHNNAKTKWSNLYHGILLLVFIFLLSPIIEQVPLSALAIILVYSGFKLASPKIFKNVYKQGIEQLIFFMGTLLITLYTDLLIGLFGGMLIALITHLLLSKIHVLTFIKMILKSKSKIVLKNDGSYNLNIMGISNFLNIINFKKLLNKVPLGSKVNIDFSNSILVDLTILEETYEFKKYQKFNGGNVNIIGLDKHSSSSNNKLALKFLTSSKTKLTTRQLKLQNIAKEYGYTFRSDESKFENIFNTFYFFKKNIITQNINSFYWVNKKDKVNCEISDVIFNEGAFDASEEYRTTVCIINLTYKIPKFTIEKKELVDKIFAINKHKDIDYMIYSDFPVKYVAKLEDNNEMKDFFNDGMKSVIEHSNINHIESNGTSIMIFNNYMHVAKISELLKLHEFANKLIATL